MSRKITYKLKKTPFNVLTSFIVSEKCFNHSAISASSISQSGGEATKTNHNKTWQRQQQLEISVEATAKKPQAWRFVAVFRLCEICCWSFNSSTSNRDTFRASINVFLPLSLSLFPSFLLCNSSLPLARSFCQLIRSAALHSCMALGWPFCVRDRGYSLINNKLYVYNTLYIASLS